VEQIEIDLRNALKEKEHVVIAIDGMSASGKTTYAQTLQEKYNARVIHMDDFYLPLAIRNDETLKTYGKNIDINRFKEEILNNLNNDIWYVSYNCQTDSFNEGILLKNTRVTIIEGAYALLKDFGRYYDFAYVLVIDDANQIKRLEKRVGHQKTQIFLNLWIKLENKYLKEEMILKKFPVIKIKGE